MIYFLVLQAEFIYLFLSLRDEAIVTDTTLLCSNYLWPVWSRCTWSRAEGPLRRTDERINQSCEAG